MKKSVFVFLCLLLLQASVLANLNDVFIADIQYDWIDKSEIEREAIISEVRDIIFTNGALQRNEELREQIKDRLKDKNYKEHYLAASAGYKEYGDYNISAFYYKKQKNIYMYAIQYKKDITKSYYYDALGHLRYVDFIYGEYPDYPYYSIQYRISGAPVSAIYFVSKDTQYLFEPDGTFKGVWYKHNLYDRESKIILTRTTF